MHILTFYRVPLTLPHQFSMLQSILCPFSITGSLSLHVDDVEIPKAARESKAQFSKALAPQHSLAKALVIPQSSFPTGIPGLAMIKGPWVTAQHLLKVQTNRFMSHSHQSKL